LQSKTFAPARSCASRADISSPARPWTGSPTLGPAELQIAEDLFIGPIYPEEREGCMIFSNHSCDPNIGVQGQIVFVALRRISAGEELTHDWATTDDDNYTLECRCGAAKCRGIVQEKISGETICSENIAACSPGTCSRRSRSWKPVSGSRLLFNSMHGFGNGLGGLQPRAQSSWRETRKPRM
jgi:SET domain